PCELGLEAGTELEQRRQSAPRDDLAGGGSQDPGHALQQRRLAGAVVSEEPDRRALGHLEVDVAERPELLRRRPSETDDPFLQRRVSLVREQESLRDAPDADRGGHRRLRAPRRSRLRRDRTRRARRRTGPTPPRAPAPSARGTTTDRRPLAGSWSPCEHH